MYLMQRLKPPRPGPPGMKAAHHVFGGGLLGLSQGAWDALDPVCTLDYMGSAEYEFGAVPAFFRAWVEQEQELDLWYFDLKPGEYEVTYLRGRKTKRPLPPVQTRRVYGIRTKDSRFSRGDIEAAFRKVALGKTHVKSGAYHTRALDPVEEWDMGHRAVLGWLCLEENCALFTDETMWRGFATLFGAEAESPPPLDLTPNWAAYKKPELVAAAVQLGCVSTKTEANKLSKQALVDLLSE